MRSAVVLLAIVALVMCPYDCAAKAVLLRASPIPPAPGCCARCQAVEPGELLAAEQRLNEPVPARPQPSEDGKSCLCEGAVFYAGANAGAAAVELSFSSAPADSATLDPRKGQASGERRRCVPPWHQSGRWTRIAFSSLLL